MDRKPASGIYMIRDAVSGRRYIGSAVNIRKRWGEHRRGLSSGKHHSKFMLRTWEKRPASLEFSVILVCDPDNLLMYEQIAIDHYRPEFNTATIAGSQKGYKHSEESRKRMSASRRKDFSPMTGKRHSIESRLKISMAKSGVKAKPEHIEKRKAAIAALPIPPGKRKLSFQEVREIRDLTSSRVMTQLQVSVLYGISNSVVSEIHTGKAYGWMTSG